MEKFKLIDNYIYLFHTDEWLVIPQYPDDIQDSMGSNFSSKNILARTAPIYSYSYSGPREVQVKLNLHRDMLRDCNLDISNFKVDLDEDYIETLVKKLQSIALPRYQATDKSVIPPSIAVKFGEQLFVKGIVDSSISVTYQKPILADNKYAVVDVSFSVKEVSPYDAISVGEKGSFRGLTQQFIDGLYNKN